MTEGRDDVVHTVRDVILEVLPGLPPEEIRGGRTLKDLGADSVDRIEIIVRLRELLEVQAPMSGFSRLPDLDAMVDLLVAEGGKR